MDCSIIFIKYYGENAWICEETYESLEWLDKTRPKPTMEELEDKYDLYLMDTMREQRNQLL